MTASPRIGGMIPLINIQLGEIIVGGVGSGMYGMLLFAILSVFVAGLMVGRTPEYVGKKIEAKEVKMAMLAILVLPLMYLGWTAVAMLVPSAVAAMNNPGPHGFTEVLYAYTSQDRQQRLRLRRAQRQHAVLQSHRRHGDVRRPVLDDHPDHGDRRLAGRQEVDARRRPERSRPRADCSSAWSSASSSSSAASPSSRRSRSARSSSSSRSMPVTMFSAN